MGVGVRRNQLQQGTTTLKINPPIEKSPWRKPKKVLSYHESSKKDFQRGRVSLK